MISWAVSSRCWRAVFSTTLSRRIARTGEPGPQQVDPRSAALHIRGRMRMISISHRGTHSVSSRRPMPALADYRSHPPAVSLRIEDPPAAAREEDLRGTRSEQTCTPVCLVSTTSPAMIVTNRLTQTRPWHSANQARWRPAELSCAERIEPRRPIPYQNPPLAKDPILVGPRLLRKARANTLALWQDSGARPRGDLSTM